MMRRNKVRPDYGEITIQTEPIPFGKFVKRHYYFLVDNKIHYKFTTTARSHSECMQICRDWAKDNWGSVESSFKTVLVQNGQAYMTIQIFRKRKELDNEITILLPTEYLEIRKKKGEYEAKIRL